MAFRKAFWRWVTTRGADVPKEQCGQPCLQPYIKEGYHLPNPVFSIVGLHFILFIKCFGEARLFR
jgi:hypothetical protein